MDNLNMTAVAERATTIDGIIDEDLLASLIGDVTDTDSAAGQPDEILEAANAEPADFNLEDLIGAEVEEALANAAEAGDSVLPIAESLEASDVAGDEAPAKKTKGKKAAAPKAPKPAKEAKAPKAPKEAKAPKEPKPPKEAKAPKEPKAPAVTYINSKRSQVLMHRLGAKANEYLMLEAGDLSLSEDAQAAKRQEILDFIDRNSAKSGGDGGAVKVMEKLVMLFGWMASGKPVSELNEVMRRTFSVLLTQGELTSGDKGNLQTDLLAKPYSVGTARSQANQMFMLLPLLKVTVKEKGRMVPNPDSLILMKMKAELAL